MGSGSDASHDDWIISAIIVSEERVARMLSLLFLESGGTK